ncbi:MAG: UDP-N-acetylglucosamine 1-carboxyvinyltransferase [Nitrospirota bacterium]
MDKLVIHGGRRLKGEVYISGAKNAALPIIAASILSSGPAIIREVPDLKDIVTLGKLFSHFGAEFHYEDRCVSVNAARIKVLQAPYDLVRTMRASILVLGPLLARYGRAEVSLPGGCAIGARPIDLHLMGLEKMGAAIELSSGYIIARAKRLKGASLYLDIPTVTGTENLMMAATLARGITVIENAAREPEVVDLANALLSMGARIKGAGESVIEIEGVDELEPLKHVIIPDRIEAGTFMTMAGITGSEITIKKCRLDHLDATIAKLKEVGLMFEPVSDGIRVIGPSRPAATDIKTMPYPGFPTDMQAQFMALMCVADGTSLIKETIFENRFMHVAELKRMGADISVEDGIATIKGVGRLKSAPLMATDLRASASLVIAALAAKGETVIHRVYHLDRGYEKMEEKLRKLGADVRRLKE